MNNEHNQNIILKFKNFLWGDYYDEYNVPVSRIMKKFSVISTLGALALQNLNKYICATFKYNYSVWFFPNNYS